MNSVLEYDHKEGVLNIITGALRSKEWNEIVRLCVAELFCTMALVIIPCVGALESPDFYIFHLYSFNAALCYGLSCMMTIVIAGHISGGQSNPAVTICCFIFGIFRIFDVLFYIIAQLFGALIGAIIIEVRGISKDDVCYDQGTGSIRINDDIPIGKRVIMLVAESLGTITIVLLACMSAVHEPLFFFMGHPIHLALGYGLSLTTTLLTFKHISGGHFNPVVSICAFGCGKISLWHMIWCILVQFAGSLIGGALVITMIPDKIRGSAPALCTPWIPPRSTLARCLMAELLGTTFFLFVCCAMWDYRNRKWQETAPIKAGLTISGLVLALGGYSKAHFNPARSMGPAIVNGEMLYLWVYIVPQFIAAIVVPIVYRLVFDGMDFERPGLDSYETNDDI